MAAFLAGVIIGATFVGVPMLAVALERHGAYLEMHEIARLAAVVLGLPPPERTPVRIGLLRTFRDWRKGRP
jgi:hypothetical protein